MSFYVNTFSGIAHFPHGPHLVLYAPAECAVEYGCGRDSTRPIICNNRGRLKKEIYCENVRREHWRESSISISR
jgi:hypothetical protein